MKKRGFILAGLIGLIVFAGCHSKVDGETQVVIDQIVRFQTEIANSDRTEGQRVYKYVEKDFSFKLSFDKEQDVYLIDAWIPYGKKPSKQNWKYCVTAEKELIRYSYDSDYTDYLRSGHFKVIYRSGKFVK